MLRKSRIAMLVAGTLFAMQAGAELVPSDDAISLDRSASSSQQVTVFNPGESHYSIVPGTIPVAISELAILIPADEPLPQQLTVFDPSGLSYSYEFTPVEVTILEPIDVIAMEDDVSIAPVVLSDEDAMLRPTYVAHFVSPPSYTGALEETIN
jgi:hypothetical protein